MIFICEAGCFHHSRKAKDLIFIIYGEINVGAHPCGRPICESNTTKYYSNLFKKGDRKGTSLQILT